MPYYSTLGRHETEVVQATGVGPNTIFWATCSCGWESTNLHTHRRGAADDAHSHRTTEAELEVGR